MDIWNYQEVLLVWAKKGFKSQKFSFTCFDCNKSSETTLQNLKSRGLLCSNCSRTRTKTNNLINPDQTSIRESSQEHLEELQNLKANYFKSEEAQKLINEKRQKTVEGKYGTTNVSKLETVRTKIVETQTRNYGKAFLATKKAREALTEYRQEHLEDIQTKTKTTCLEKYGTEFYLQSEESKTKTRETCLEKYGVDNVSKVPEVLDKIKESLLENYGVDNIMKLPEMQEHFSELKKEWWKNLPEFGRESFRKTISESLKTYWLSLPDEVKEALNQKRKDWWENLPEFGRLDIRRKQQEAWNNKSPEERKDIRRRANKKNKYKAFDGEVFDSNWELKYYEYCKDKGFNIIREPVELEYFFEGKAHHYYPDFSVNGQLVEVKSNHLKDSNGKWICPYKNPNYSKEYMNGLYEAKRQCALSNGVKILYQEDLIELGIKL